MEHTSVAPANGAITEPATNSNGSVSKASPTDQSAPPVVSPSLSSSNGPLKTPFTHPTSSSTPRPTQPLTPDQQTKYTSLLTTVRSWTTLPSTSAPKSPKTALTDTERLWLTRECLLRYLRASKWNLPHAATRLEATLIWRREYGVEAHTADYISPENETGKQVILGYDNDCRPCLYLNPHKQNTQKSDKQIHHLVFMLETCIDLMPPGTETLVLLVNFKDARKGDNASPGQGRQVISILQNHYPERLGRACLKDVPWIIWGFFKIINPFIDPLTREKMKFDVDLRELVPPEQLLRSYGGNCEFEYEHTIYWPKLIAMAEERRAAMRERWEGAGKRVGESEAYLKGVGKPVGDGGGEKVGV